MTSVQTASLRRCSGLSAELASERALHMLAQGRPLNDVLAELSLSLEAHDAGLRAAVFLVRPSPPSCSFCAAPSLPPDYAQTLAPGGRDADPARTWAPLPAAFAAAVQQICCPLTPTMEADPAWAVHTALLAEMRMQAAWCVPVLSFNDSVIGILVVHHHSLSRPRARLGQIIYTTARLAALAILRSVAETDRERLLADLRFERLEREALGTELRLAARAREDFMCLAAHELRTPLSALMLQADSAARLMARNEPRGERLVHKVGAMQKQIDRMKHLVEDLLDVSQVAEGNLKLHLERVDLAALAREAAERVADAYARAHCTLNLDINGPAWGRWDALRLSQVITNLLTNGLKYGMGAPVDLGVWADGQHAYLRVVDHGIGIAEDQHERIFRRFGRVVSEKNYGGFGLGLWLCKQIVDALGGSIVVDSAANAGASFNVTLPRALLDVETAAPPNGPADAPHP